MRIIEIAALPGGGHRNQTGVDHLPIGWAEIPEDMAVPETFPFVALSVEGDRVTAMTGLPMPPAEPGEVGAP